VENCSGVDVWRCPWDRKASFVEEIASLSQSFLHYFREAENRQGRVDLVHCHEWLTLETGLRAQREFSLPLAVSFHSTEWSRTGTWPKQGDSASIADLERNGVTTADSVVATSYQVRRFLEQQFHLPDWKSEVVYHGVDLESFDRSSGDAATTRQKLGFEPEDFVVLFAGRFSRTSGGDLAAAAAALLAKPEPRIKFLFVGAGEDLEVMRRSAGPVSRFLAPSGGRVSPAIYRASDLVIAPFRRDVSGRAVLAAWAASRPAVVLSNTVPSEFILDHTNGWVVVDHPDALADTIVKAKQDRGGTTWMGRNGRVAVETAFTWEESARRLARSYQRKVSFTTRLKNPPPAKPGKTG
jgi:glycosyltransferase involved in cell wall biosynthesis